MAALIHPDAGVRCRRPFGTPIWWAVQGESNVYTWAAPDCADTSTFLSGRPEPGGVRSNATHVSGFDRGTPDGPSHVTGTSLVWRLSGLAPIRRSSGKSTR